MPYPGKHLLERSELGASRIFASSTATPAIVALATSCLRKKLTRRMIARLWHRQTRYPFKYTGAKRKKHETLLTMSTSVYNSVHYLALQVLLYIFSNACALSTQSVIFHLESVGFSQNCGERCPMNAVADQDSGFSPAW